MILSDREIMAAIEHGQIVISAYTCLAASKNDAFEEAIASD